MLPWNSGQKVPCGMSTSDSSGSTARIGWMCFSPGANRFVTSWMLWSNRLISRLATFGSWRPVCDISQASGPRWSGDAASTLCVRVVAVRGSPSTNTGSTIRSSAISGRSASKVWMRSRLM